MRGILLCCKNERTCILIPLKRNRTDARVCFTPRAMVTHSEQSHLLIDTRTNLYAYSVSSMWSKRYV